MSNVLRAFRHATCEREGNAGWAGFLAGGVRAEVGFGCVVVKFMSGEVGKVGE